MKGRKGRVSLLIGVFCLVAALLATSLIVLPLFGVTNAPLKQSHALLERFFSFSATPSRFGLVPLAVLLFLWATLIFGFRTKKRFFLLLIPLTAVMAYTLYTLSHLLQGSTRPLFSSSLLASSTDLRSASFKVVLAFLAETALFILVALLTDAIHRYRKAKVEREKRRKSSYEQKALQRQQKSKKRSLFGKHKRKKRPSFEQAEEDKVTLVKKPVAEEKLEEGNELGTQQVNFPSIAEVPSLGSLSKRRSFISKPSKQEVIEEDEIQVQGKVSIGALHTLTEERKRNNGLSYLERKQLELKQANQEEKPLPKEPVQLSGFLQGALEAVGKAPQKKQDENTEPRGRAKGMLAEAVQQQQTKQEEPLEESSDTLQIRERILSVQYEQKPVPPLFAPEQSQEPEKTKPAAPALEKPSFVQPSFFAPQSTAKPINGGLCEDIPAQEEAVEEEDLLEPESGVGGLSPSALINKSRITYQFPPAEMLVTYPKVSDVIDETTLKRGEILVSTLMQFNVIVELVNIVRGPTVTMFELLPAPGVRVNSIVNLADNIALALAATQVRIVAPIPGKSAVGVEIPNLKRDIIGFREMLGSLSDAFGIPMVLGRNLMGEPIVIDVIKAPHLLIAGSTGSGKSVCVNSLICSVLFRRSPKQVRMILVDPKIVELNIYNGIPHLLTPVITEAKRTLKALDFCLYEMDRRYKLLQGLNVRNIIGYNEKIENGRIAREKLPYILVVIDEFADLMHLVGKDMESKVSRLAAMSRAVGIHLVLATQRPSVDVITGVIKNNIPTRIAFAVTSATDSRIILDEQGADKLLGKGDMLYMSSSNPSSERIQGSFLSDHEVEEVVKFVSGQGVPDFIDESFFEDEEQKASESQNEDAADGNDDDEIMQRALAIVVERKCASASYLQRRLKIGYNRAARLVEQMEALGYVGPPNGSKPRELIKYP